MLSPPPEEDSISSLPPAFEARPHHETSPSHHQTSAAEADSGRWPGPPGHGTDRTGPSLENVILVKEADQHAGMDDQPPDIFTSQIHVAMTTRRRTSVVHYTSHLGHIEIPFEERNSSILGLDSPHRSMQFNAQQHGNEKLV